jgi:hypothetical protein
VDVLLEEEQQGARPRLAHSIFVDAAYYAQWGSCSAPRCARATKTCTSESTRPFRRRNDVAHRGRPIDETEARQLVGTRYSAFHAVRSLETTRT